VAELSGELDESTVSDLGQLVLVDDLESLFRAHYGRLVRALTIAGGSRETAADAVQEAFVKAHLNWRRISPARRPGRVNPPCRHQPPAASAAPAEPEVTPTTALADHSEGSRDRGGWSGHGGPGDG